MLRIEPPHRILAHATPMGFTMYSILEIKTAQEAEKLCDQSDHYDLNNEACERIMRKVTIWH